MYKYFSINFPLIQYESEDVLCEKIRETFIRAVKKRLMSDRPLGCLLSGGLDSSLICSILAKNYTGLQTFSIGLPGSPDIIKAREVAQYLGTKHHEILCTEDMFLKAIEEVIWVLGTYDITTIRASVGHFLVCRYIRDNTDIKVLFSGEYSDEVHMSYLYAINAPSADEFQKESIRLITDIGYFDNLRGDHCISNSGLEARVPFADRDFMELVLGIDPELKMFGKNGRNGRMEKYLIRKAFEGWLPESVLWRRKDGFSDSVSDIKRSWSVIIKEYVETIISDEEYMENRQEEKSKEAYYYKKVYKGYYPKIDFELTPYMWLPRWCGNVDDPSARVLKEYEAK